MKRYIFFALSCITFALNANSEASDTALPPRVSIITSMYKGERFIASFLENMVQQTIFNQCELIIINANSPENEEPIIRAFQAKYPNIIYKRLDRDPGLYAVWNLCISMARGEFIVNANLDDRVAPEYYGACLSFLEENPAIDLVYADFLVTHVAPSWTFAECPKEKISYTTSLVAFSLPRLKDRCYIGPNPFWRKSFHQKYGTFNGDFKIAGDWEMWLRAACKGAQFLKIPGISGLYYENPIGLSSLSQSKGFSEEKRARIFQHNKEIAAIRSFYAKK